jgi:hypothetical protein
MNVSRSELIAAARDAGIEEATAAELWSQLESRASKAEPARFTAANFAYYLGGLLVIGAMTYFMTLGWFAYGGWFIFVVSLGYIALLGIAGYAMSGDLKMRRPGGILVTAAVCVTPLAVYGFERMTGWWVDGSDPGTYASFYELVHQSWIFMEIATVCAGLVALRSVRFPFITLPIAFALWFLSMDGAVFLLHGGDDFLARRYVSLAFGVGMIAVAMAIDRRSEEDYAFWLYLYGAAALYGGLSVFWDRGDERQLALFAAISVLVLALSVLLGRRALTVAGALGLFAYLSRLAWTVFKDSLGFPFVLTLIGLATIGAGVAYQRNEERIRKVLIRSVPAWIVAALPSSRAV